MQHLCLKSKSKTLNCQQIETCQSDYFLGTAAPPPPPEHTHPVDRQVLRPDCPKSLFILDLCLFNAGFYGFLCTSLSPCVARSAWSKGIFFTGYLVTLFFSTISVQKSPSSKVPGPWSFSQSVDMETPMVWWEDPRWFQPPSSPAVTHSIYSYFVLKQANNLGGRTTELIITQGLIGMRCVAYVDINHVVIFFICGIVIRTQKGNFLDNSDFEWNDLGGGCITLYQRWIGARWHHTFVQPGRLWYMFHRGSPQDPAIRLVQQNHCP